MSLLALRRLLQAVPLLLLISVVVFALLHAAPGGPVEIYLSNPNVRPEDIARLRASLGLDRPLPVQYVSWLGAFLRGDWGYSFTDGRPVVERLLERVPATLELVATSIAMALVASVGIAVYGAVRARSVGARAVNAITLAGISLPVFWFGLVLQLIFAVALHWLPSSGRSSFGDGGMVDRLQHLVLPAIVLAAVHAAAWSRYLRASIGEVLRAPFVLVARSRGVAPAPLLLRHVLRNALLPFLTVALLDAALMVSGAVVTESVFAWPGLGGLFTEALARRDYALLMAFLMVTSTAVILLNLVADVAYRALDPRTAA